MKRRRRRHVAWMQSAEDFARRIAIRSLGRDVALTRRRELADVEECAIADMSPFADKRRRSLFREVNL